MSKVKIMTDNVASFEKCSNILKYFNESFKKSIKYIEDNGLYILEFMLMQNMIPLDLVYLKNINTAQQSK